ncbi:MAG: NUDIX domain-containing protein [Chloroflexi bacterium]|nr:NUDIX domain-containing protein [Chloroflexota bacterium]
MASTTRECADGPRKVIVEAHERILDDIFRVDRAVVRYEKLDGTLSEPMTRLVFERGDSVTVLPYDRRRCKVVLIRQFRYPVYVRDPEQAWLWEAIAGAQEEGEDAETVARREAMEEAGYTLGRLVHVGTVYPSPGGTSERIHLFIAPVLPSLRRQPGGGVDPGEDICVAEFDLEQALAWMREGRIVDAKTILLLQYLAMNWDSLPDAEPPPPG